MCGWAGESDGVSFDTPLTHKHKHNNNTVLLSFYEKYKSISDALRTLQELQLKITGNTKECEKQIHTQIEGVMQELRSYEAMLIKELHKTEENKLGATRKRVGVAKDYLKTLSDVKWRAGSNSQIWCLVILSSIIIDEEIVWRFHR